MDVALHPLEVLALLNRDARVRGVAPTGQRDELGHGDVRIERHLTDAFDQRAQFGEPRPAPGGQQQIAVVGQGAGRARTATGTTPVLEAFRSFC
ncbi:hypothetical protein OG864_02040 [Streptomyces sp. NBC_00124]|uniref:hypothetical protein n=1 Tax=Streptomyces sp. NBC_00124 TaxID=2975662 RepID=UPI0022518769|nr:hypothetical protein [Streptomyces sp. NBC_00124]MCX5357538.1 hypothetical protein [Streptomyces sp. NBC_00124]